MLDVLTTFENQMFKPYFSLWSGLLIKIYFNECIKAYTALLRKRVMGIPGCGGSLVVVVKRESPIIIPP